MRVLYIRPNPKNTTPSPVYNLVTLVPHYPTNLATHEFRCWPWSVVPPGAFFLRFLEVPAEVLKKASMPGQAQKTYRHSYDSDIYSRG